MSIILNLKTVYYLRTLYFCLYFSVTLYLYMYVKILSHRSSFNYKDTIDARNIKFKYILQWTSPNTTPFIYMGVGQRTFIERNCSFTNCVVTSDRTYLEDYTQFDVIAFHGPEIIDLYKEELPARRSPHQKYVFASIESSQYYPICSSDMNSFFNWTWTYKLDSDSRWGYIVIRDSDQNIIGPKKEMHWMKLEDMNPVDNKLRKRLKRKTKAAAWFVSNCFTLNGREIFANDLRKVLNKYDLTLDIYGDCDNLKCPRDKESECNRKIESDYYFYLAFENAFSEDYVTEKILTALNNNAVPVVYGGANYTRFMPDGIYLNARELGVKKLAAKMNELIQDFDQYVEYFRWKNHYTYHRQSESPLTDEYCRFCSILNDEELVKKTSIYHNFKEWWDPPNRC